MARYPMLLHEITADDVGRISIRKHCPTCKQVTHYVSVSTLMGRITIQDVGKRIYAVRDEADMQWVYQVDSDESLAKRLRGE